MGTRAADSAGLGRSERDRDRGLGGRDAQPQAALPLSGYDDIALESLAERISALDIQQLEQLIGYERNHSARREVLDLLEGRRSQLVAHEPTTGRSLSR